MRQSLSQRLSETDRAYLAGLFDGEGTLGYYFVRGRHSATVMIVNTDPRVIRWVRETVGYGNVHSRDKNESRRKHVAHFWRISDKPRVREFLQAIHSYLIVKKEQAEVLLALWQLEGDSKVKRTVEAVARRHDAVMRLKSLKRSFLTPAPYIH